MFGINLEIIAVYVKPECHEIQENDGNLCHNGNADCVSSGPSGINVP